MKETIQRLIAVVSVCMGLGLAQNAVEPTAARPEPMLRDPTALLQGYERFVESLEGRGQRDRLVVAPGPSRAHGTRTGTATLDLTRGELKVEVQGLADGTEHGTVASSLSETDAGHGADPAFFLATNEVERLEASFPDVV